LRLGSEWKGTLGSSFSLDVSSAFVFLKRLLTQHGCRPNTLNTKNDSKSTQLDQNSQECPVQHAKAPLPFTPGTAEYRNCLKFAMGDRPSGSQKVQQWVNDWGKTDNKEGNSGGEQGQ